MCEMDLIRIVSQYINASLIDLVIKKLKEDIWLSIVLECILMF